MPSINEVISRVEVTKPNAIAKEQQGRWLADLDGRIYNEVTKFDAPDVLPPRAWPDDADAPLLVGAPYDGLYDYYLQAMIEFGMREFSEQNNTTELFNEAMNRWRAAYRREHPPKFDAKINPWR